MSRIAELLTKSAIASTVIHFVGIEECTKSVCLVNKQLYHSVLQSFLENRPDVIAAKPLPASWDTYITIIDLGRHLVFKLGLIKISPEGSAVLQSSGGDISRIKEPRFGQDLANLTASMYTFWASTSTEPERGIFHYIDQLTKDEPELAHLHEALVHDAQYWQSSRVYGKFIVLFERPDGTVVVSDDFQRVYLVLGISQSLAEVANMKQAGKKKFVHNPPYPSPHFHGPIIGLKCAVTLLNWEGKICYDGIIRPLTQVSKPILQLALQAYIHAMNHHTMIIQLEKKSPNFHDLSLVNPVETLLRAESYCLKYPEVITMLSQQPPYDSIQSPGDALWKHPYAKDFSPMPSPLLRHCMSQDTIHSTHTDTEYPSLISIGLIRAGYTETMNSHHLLLVMNLTTGRTLFTEETVTLTPTIDDYLHLLRRLYVDFHIRPDQLSMDAYEHYHVFKEMILSHCHIPVYYYPPPSMEYFDLAKTVASFYVKSSPTLKNKSASFLRRSSSRSISRMPSQIEGEEENEEEDEDVNSLENIRKEGEQHPTATSAWKGSKKAWKSFDEAELMTDKRRTSQQVGPQCAYCGIYRWEDGKSSSKDVGEMMTTGLKENIGRSGLRKFFRCGRCKNVYYCCKDHQVLDWKEHQVLCCFPIASASASFSIIPTAYFTPHPSTAACAGSASSSLSNSSSGNTSTDCSH